MSAAAGGAAVAIAMAIKASGVVVRVEPEEFEKILRRIDQPLIVQAEGGFFSKKYQYLTGYKGLAFFTRSPQPMRFAPGTEIVMAKKLWMPG